MKYRKKPIVIEAVQWVGTNAVEIGEFVTVEHEVCPIRTVLKIPTLEGVMEAAWGDYIIKGVNGEFYPCKPNIFEKSYESVENQ